MAKKKKPLLLLKHLPQLHQHLLQKHPQLHQHLPQKHLQLHQHLLLSQPSSNSQGTVSAPPVPAIKKPPSGGFFVCASQFLGMGNAVLYRTCLSAKLERIFSTPGIGVS